MPDPGPDCGVDTLYYDGLCPLCAKEIAQLQSIRGADLALVDIHELADGEHSDIHGL